MGDPRRFKAFAALLEREARARHFAVQRLALDIRGRNVVLVGRPQRRCRRR